MSDVAHSGRTVMFVSHNLAAIENFCSKTILLKNGKLEFLGPTLDAVSNYLAASENTSITLDKHPDRKGSGEIQVQSIDIVDSMGKSIREVQCGQDLEIHLHYKFNNHTALEKVLVGINLYSSLGVPVFLHHNRLTKDPFGPIKRNGTFVCKIKRLPLAPSVYTLGFSVMANMGKGSQYYDKIENAMKLNVVNGDFYSSGETPPASHGIVLINARWELTENH
jgi:lipopolysaccharide transport system ATP-binding protein